MKKFPLIANVLLLVYLLLLISSYLISGIIVLEWIISFLFYLFILNLIFISAVLVILIYKRPTQNSLSGRMVNINLGLLIFIILVFSLQIFNSSYRKPVVNFGRKDSRSVNLRVAFFNKLFENEDKSIVAEIKKVHPDILGLAEINTKSPVLQELEREYRYNYTSTCQCKGGMEVSILSKQPLKNLVSISMKGSPMIKAEIEVNRDTYYVYVIHPQAPFSQPYLEDRNKALDTISDTITANNTIVMGDFNTTQWSKNFRDILSTKKIYDSASSFGLHNTWGGRFISLQLDHILLSTDIETKSFNIGDHLGSDHRLVYADLGV